MIREGSDVVYLLACFSFWEDTSGFKTGIWKAFLKRYTSIDLLRYIYLLNL